MTSRWDPAMTNRSSAPCPRHQIQSVKPMQENWVCCWNQLLPRSFMDSARCSCCARSMD